MSEFYFIYDSFLGRVFVYSDGRNITKVDLKVKSRRNALIKRPCELEVFARVKEWLDIYFGGGYPDFKLPVQAEGTKFSKNVWRIISNIPYGHILTYGEIADMISSGSGNRMSARAVGAACGRNPVPVLIPCHRVLGRGNRLTGYSSGLDIKIKLLELEKTEFVL